MGDNVMHDITRKRICALLEKKKKKKTCAHDDC